MNKEIRALEKYQTQEVVDLLKEGLWTANRLLQSSTKLMAFWTNPARGKWVHSIVYETFEPMAKMYTIRILLSLTENKDWSLYQFDVKNAFLHGDFEEYHMDVPTVYEHKSHLIHKKVLYWKSHCPNCIRK